MPRRPQVDTGSWPARSLVAGVVCGGGAVVAHTAVAGHRAGPGALAILALTVAAALLLRDHAPRLPALALVTGTVQLVAHLAMAATHPGATGPEAMAGHGAMAPHPGAHAPSADGGVPMLLGHLAVVVVTVLLARGTDRLLLDTARRVLVRLVPRVPGVLPHTAIHHRGAAPAPRPTLGRGRLLGTSADPRGPPAHVLPSRP